MGLDTDGEDHNDILVGVDVLEHPIFSHPEFPVRQGIFSQEFAMTSWHLGLMGELFLDYLENRVAIAGGQLTQLTFRVSGKPDLIWHGASIDATSETSW